MLQLDFHCYQVSRQYKYGNGRVPEHILCWFQVAGPTAKLTLLASHRTCISYKHFRFQTGLADVHVEISFANEYYPCDFAFTYECGMGESTDAVAGGSGGGLFFVLNVLGLCGCVVGCAYNYAVLQKRGEEIIPGIGELASPALPMACSPSVEHPQIPYVYKLPLTLRLQMQNTYGAPGNSARVCSTVAQGWLRLAAALCPAPRAISLCERKGFGYIRLCKMVRPCFEAFRLHLG